MKEPIDTSAKQKPGHSSGQGQLTPQEIESLKQDAKEAGEKFHELWKEQPFSQSQED